MISLISRWKLKNGCPSALVAALDQLGREVREREPGTLMYLVHVTARPPLDGANHPVTPPPPPVPPGLQSELIFVEAYADAAAFAAHVTGPGFTVFRTTQLAHFYEDPQRPGWPQTETTFLERIGEG